MEVCRGGRLGSLLRKKEYFDKETSRFVIGSTVQALDYLHKEKIIHRYVRGSGPTGFEISLFIYFV